MESSFTEVVGTITPLDLKARVWRITALKSREGLRGGIKDV